MDHVKHSPGPWFVCGDEGHPHVNETWNEGSTIGDANGMRVADLMAPLKQERIRANARLIAAAPELLEALNDCVAVLTDPVVGTVKHDDPDWYLALDRAVTKARAALAKAGA